MSTNTFVDIGSVEFFALQAPPPTPWYPASSAFQIVRRVASVVAIDAGPNTNVLFSQTRSVGVTVDTITLFTRIYSLTGIASPYLQ